MERFMYRAILKEEWHGRLDELTGACGKRLQSLVGEGALMTASLFLWDGQLFLYYECINQAISPEELTELPWNGLEKWPGEAGKKRWAPMINIFHFDRPRDEEHWRRGLPVAERVGSVARIKPEMLSSYIYHHYRLQEGSRKNGNKYCTIGLHDNYIFHYEEHPIVEAPPSFDGKLGSIAFEGDWQTLMKPHFIPWNRENRDEFPLARMLPLISC